MSRLEVSVKPILIELMDGSREVVALDNTDRATLGRWAFKTAILLNAASNFHSNVPQEHYHALVDPFGIPPEGVRAYGQQHHGDRTFFWLQGGGWRVVADDAADVKHVDLDYVNQESYKISFQLRKLLLLVAYWPGRPWRQVIWRGIHIPLWPIRGPIAWYDDDPLPSGFSWNDSNKAHAEFHMSVGVRHDPLLP